MTDTKDRPAKLAQKDRDARWTVKFSKAKPSDDGSPRIDIAVPSFGYKNHIGIDRRHGLIRTLTATHATLRDGAQLPNLISKANTASDVWADTAYRSKANEQHLADGGLRSQIHRKKRTGRPMAKNVARANNARSKVRAAIEHVFGRQKGPMGLAVRIIGLASVLEPTMTLLPPCKNERVSATLGYRDEPGVSAIEVALPSGIKLRSMSPPHGGCSRLFMIAPPANLRVDLACEITGMQQSFLAA